MPFFPYYFDYFMVALFGSWTGSFLNVVIIRVPAGESIVKPRSHCRDCGEMVRWYDNVPILSYLILRGQCRWCGAQFSPKYMFIEALTAGLFAAVWHLVVSGGAGSFEMAVAQGFALFALVGVLVALSFIDLATYRIPNVITYPGIPILTAASLLFDLPHWWDGPLGAVLGYGSLRLLSDGYFWLTGREGMGYGDAKLLALTGGLLGWQSLMPTVFAASVIGSVVGISVGLLRQKDGGETSLRLVKIPFGPYLAIGALLYLFFGDPLALVLQTMMPG